VIKGSILQKCRLKPFLWGHGRGLNEVSMQYIVGLAAILLHYQTWHAGGHIICLFHFIKQTLFYKSQNDPFVFPIVSRVSVEYFLIYNPID